MGNRIRWILVSYLTNRMFLVAIAFSFLWFVGPVWFNLTRSLPYQSNLPPAPTSNLLVSSLGSLAEVRRRGLEGQVDAIDLGGLWSSMEIARQKPQSSQPGFRYSIGPPPTSFYDVLSEFPNLRSVSLGFQDSPGGLSEVSKLRQITYLSMGGTVHDVAPLASLKNLQRLDLNTYQPLTNVAALASLPRLETITLASDQALSDKVFGELAKLPHLKALGIRSNLGNQGISLAGIAELGNSPSLETLYVGGNDVPRQFDLLAEARQALPQLEVRPAIVLPRPPLVACFPPVMLASAVGFLLASQFRSAALRLAPGFAKEHLLVAIGWTVLAGLAGATSVCLTGLSVGTSVFLAAGWLAIAFGGGVELFGQRNYGASALTNRCEASAHGIAIFGVLFALLLPSTNTGPHPLLLLALAGTGSLSLWRAAKMLRLMPELHGGGGVQQPSGWWLDSGRRELQIESLEWEPTAKPRWNAVQRWRLGNPPLHMLFVALLFICGAIGTTIFMGRMIGSRGPDFNHNQASSFAFMLLVFVCGQVATFWRKRLLSLDVESLWPISRSMLRRELAMALAVDLIVPALSIAAFAAVTINLPETWLLLPLSVQWHDIAWRNIPGDFALLSIVLWTVCYASSAILIIVERAWLRLLLVFAAMFLTILATVGIAALHDDLPRYTVGFPRVLLPYLWVPTAISGLALVWMWKLWARLEFDRQR